MYLSRRVVCTPFELSRLPPDEPQSEELVMHDVAGVFQRAATPMRPSRGRHGRFPGGVAGSRSFGALTTGTFAYERTVLRSARQIDWAGQINPAVRKPQSTRPVKTGQPQPYAPVVIEEFINMLWKVSWQRQRETSHKRPSEGTRFHGRPRGSDLVSPALEV